MDEHVPWKLALLIDDEIICNADLTWTERIIFSYVQGFDRNNKPCFATSKAIAERFHLNESHVRYARSALVKKGLLKRIERDGRLYFRTKFILSGWCPAENESEKDEQNQLLDKPTLLASANTSVGNTNTERWPAPTPPVGQRQHPPLASANTYNNTYNNNYNKTKIPDLVNDLVDEVSKPEQKYDFSDFNKAAERFGLRRRFGDAD
jgi:hypothetical protein